MKLPGIKFLCISFCINFVWLMLLLFVGRYMVAHGNEWARESVESCIMGGFAMKFAIFASLMHGSVMKDIHGDSK